MPCTGCPEPKLSRVSGDPQHAAALLRSSCCTFTQQRPCSSAPAGRLAALLHPVEQVCCRGTSRCSTPCSRLLHPLQHGAARPQQRRSTLAPRPSWSGLRTPHSSHGSPQGPSTCTSSLGGSLMLRRCALGSNATSADAALRRHDVLRVSHGAGTATARRSGTRGRRCTSTWSNSQIDLPITRRKRSAWGCQVASPCTPRTPGHSAIAHPPCPRDGPPALAAPAIHSGVSRSRGGSHQRLPHAC